MSLLTSPAVPATSSTRIITWPAASAGIVGAGLYVASTLIPGAPLSPDASTAELIDRYGGERTAVLLGAVVGGLALGPLLVFLGALRSAMVGAPGDTDAATTVTVSSWLALFLIITAGTAPLIALTWGGAGGLDPALLQWSFDLGNLAAYSLSATAAFLSVGVPTYALRRAGWLPAWVVGLAVAEMIVNLVELAGLATRSGSNAGGYAFGLGPVLWVLWLIAIAAVLARGER